MVGNLIKVLGPAVVGYSIGQQIGNLLRGDSELKTREAFINNRPELKAMCEKWEQQKADRTLNIELWNKFLEKSSL